MCAAGLSQLLEHLDRSGPRNSARGQERARRRSAAALGASAASGARALILSDVGLAGAVAATRRGTTTSARSLKRPSASAADTDSHVSVESSALSTTANEASSSYWTERAQRFGPDAAVPIADGVAETGRGFARSSPASVASAGARPRTAQKRTSADRSALSSNRRGTAAGSRSRKSAHAARQRTSASAGFRSRGGSARDPRAS